LGDPPQSTTAPMGGTLSTTPTQRRAAVTAISAATVAKLQVPPTGDGPGSALALRHPDLALPAPVLERARQCAGRGGAALVKDELVHLVALLQGVTSGRPVGPDTFGLLAGKSVDELLALLRLLMYNPDTVARLVVLPTSGPPATVCSPVAASAASAPPAAADPGMMDAKVPSSAL
jgi:hypothetical protein